MLIESEDALMVTSIRIAPDQARALARQARRQRTSKAALIRAAIDLYLALHIGDDDTPRADRRELAS